MRSPRSFAAVLLTSFALVGGLLAALFAQFVRASAPAGEVTDVLPERGIARSIYPVDYVPPLPGDAPEDLRGAVTRGYEWVQLGSATAGNGLRCSNCHFRGGITDGGRNGGISLVGGAAREPLNVADRVRQCLRVNLAAPAPPGAVLDEVGTYLVWISKGVPLYAEVPWLGLAPLSRVRPADDAAGKRVFAEVCAQCHGADGQGTFIAPPLWGARSFTSGSTMSRADLLARFVLLNMPRQNPTLSPDQAIDAAAYVLARPRPPPRGD